MPNISFDSVSEVIGDIYEAGQNPEQWQQVVERISGLFDCSRVCLTWMDANGFDAFSTVDDPDFVSEACVAAHMRDPLVPVAFAVPVGQVYNRREILDEGEFRCRELWSDWYRQRDLAEGLGCMLDMTGGCNWSLHVHRGARQMQFDGTEAKAFQLLSDHVLRAYRMGQRARDTATYAEMFTRLPIGILLVDQAGNTTVVNEEAERLLSQAGCPLSIRNGRLACSDEQNGLLLLSQIASASTGLVASGATVVLSAGTRLIASAAPFASVRFDDTGGQRSVMVILRDLSLSGSEALETHLRTLFRLTRAESRLSIALASGLSLREAAVQGEVTFKTARTYLERIFAKTNTRQQSQLVALVKGSRPLF